MKKAEALVGASAFVVFSLVADIAPQVEHASDTMTQSRGTETTGAPARDRGSGLRQCC